MNSRSFERARIRIIRTALAMLLVAQAAGAHAEPPPAQMVPFPAHRAGAVLVQEGILPAYRLRDVLVAQAMPAQRRSPGRMSRALPQHSAFTTPVATDHGTDMVEELTLAKVEADSTSATGVIGAQVAAAAEAGSERKAADFEIGANQALSAALRRYLSANSMRMQWNTRTDFIVEHPYHVRNAELGATLAEVLRPYGLIATIWEANGVVEIAQRNAEVTK